jgi:Zn-dependent peptidase ImmA (M78 family)
MDEISVVTKARGLVAEVKPTEIPVRIEAYLKHVGAALSAQDDLEEDEAGFSFQNKGKWYIGVNASDRHERRRFTICHELGHIVLGLPSEHKATPWWSYAKRPLAEILCDVFAAELLLPLRLFQPLAEEMPTSFATIDELAGRFLASRTATGSRLATVIKAPCAFVLSEQGKVRYAARSTSLREAGAWIEPRRDLPAGSISERVRAGENGLAVEAIDAEDWFKDWERGGTLLEDARHHEAWDQTLTLLSFECEEVPPPKWAPPQLSEEDELLPELDGVLRFKTKKRCR